MLEWANFIFVLIFLVEALVKMSGQGFKMYFLHMQNNFDFFLVVVSLCGMLKTKLNITAMRMIRGIRILRLFKSMHEVTKLLSGLLESVSKFFNILCLYWLVIFVFALIGMRFYGDIPNGKLGYLNNNSGF
jgi:voltage-gated sodium channel